MLDLYFYLPSGVGSRSLSLADSESESCDYVLNRSVSVASSALFGITIPSAYGFSSGFVFTCSLLTLRYESLIPVLYAGGDAEGASFRLE